MNNNWIDVTERMPDLTIDNKTEMDSDYVLLSYTKINRNTKKEIDKGVALAYYYKENDDCSDTNPPRKGWEPVYFMDNDDDDICGSKYLYEVTGWMPIPEQYERPFIVHDEDKQYL